MAQDARSARARACEGWVYVVAPMGFIALMHGKNRPNWMPPRGPVNNPNAAFLCERFRLHHDPRWRACLAIAKGTGRQCRLHALPGANHCHKHNGHRAAHLAAGVDWSLATMRSVPRKALGRIGRGSPPDGFPDIPLPMSAIARGRLYEAWLNREMAPQVWKAEHTNAWESSARDAARAAAAAERRALFDAGFTPKVR